VIEVNPAPGALARIADVVLAAGTEEVLPAILPGGGWEQEVKGRGSGVGGRRVVAGDRRDEVEK